MSEMESIARRLIGEKAIIDEAKVLHDALNRLVELDVLFQEEQDYLAIPVNAKMLALLRRAARRGARSGPA